MSVAFSYGQRSQDIAKADSNFIRKTNGTTNAELILMNGTRSVTGGFLYNHWNGRSKWRIPLVSDISGLQDSLEARIAFIDNLLFSGTGNRYMIGNDAGDITMGAEILEHFTQDADVITEILSATYNPDTAYISPATNTFKQGQFYYADTNLYLALEDNLVLRVHTNSYTKAEVNALVSGSIPTLSSHTAGYGLSGSDYDGSTARTWTADTTSSTGLVSKSRLIANYIPLGQRGANDGVATLNSSGKIPSTQIPALALVDTYVVGSEAAMLLLSTAEQGDVAIRTDESKSYILTDNNYGTLASWEELLSPIIPAETDPIWGASASAGIDGTDITNWDTAYGWGDHAGLYPLYNGTGATGTWGIGISGNAATVTTIPNLTGPITSTGTTTAVGSQTGTGSIFVMNTSPTLVTPNLGTPSAGVATNLTGTAAGLTAGAATVLATARTINGTSFNGSANITVAAEAGTLTGATLAAGVTSSSLTSVGTIGTGTWNATAIGVTKGGTGLTALGTAAQLLRVNSGATALEYFTPPLAAADGSTYGTSTFTAADFNASSGVISIDYTNGQKASSTLSGLVSATTQTFAGAKTFNIAPLFPNLEDGTAGTDSSLVVGSDNKIKRVAPISGSGVTDGDKGDVVVATSGTVWTLDYANLQAASATVPGITTTGAQTIAGDKTYTGSTIIMNNAGVASLYPVDLYLEDVVASTGAYNIPVINTTSDKVEYVTKTELFTDPNFTGNVGIGAASSGSKLDVTGAAIMFGADNGTWTARTNSTIKSGSITGPHYTNAEEPLGLFSFNSTSTTGSLAFGGGSALVNAVTDITFLTSANNTTTTGTNRMYIGSNGRVQVGSGTSPMSTLDVAGSASFSIVNKTANYTATSSDHTITCDATSGNVTITLPAASTSTGRVYHIKKIDASGNSVIIDGNASETIDGATTQTTTVQWHTMSIQSNGTAWYKISN